MTAQEKKSPERFANIIIGDGMIMGDMFPAWCDLRETWSSKLDDLLSKEKLPISKSEKREIKENVFNILSSHILETMKSSFLAEEEEREIEEEEMLQDERKS